VLPNFTNSAQLKEFIGAVQTPPLSATELKQVSDLWKSELAKKLDQPFADSSSKPTPKKL
jgi:hypothetical protein